MNDIPLIDKPLIDDPLNDKPIFYDALYHELSPIQPNPLLHRLIHCYYHRQQLIELYFPNKLKTKNNITS